MQPLQLHRTTLYITMEEPMFGQHLFNYIQEKKRFAQVQRCQGAQQLLHTSSTCNQKMVFLDVSLSDFKNLNELESYIHQLNAQHIVLFFYPVHVPLIRPLLKHNFLGYINKTNECHIIKNHIKSILQGISITDNVITTYCINNTTQNPNAPQIKFSGKQLHILNLMQQGIRRAEILLRLNITLNTYKDYHEKMTTKVRQAGYPNLKAYLQHPSF